MSARNGAWLLWLVACGPKPSDLAREVPVVEAEAPAVAAPDVPPPPWWQLCHAWNGPGPLRSPTVAWSHVLEGPVTQPLNTDGTRVYAVGNGKVYAFVLAEEGRKAWSASVDAIGPVAVGHTGLLVASRSQGIVRLDPETGKVLEAWPQDAPVQGFVLPWMSGFVWLERTGVVKSSAGWTVATGSSASGGASTDGERVYFSTLEGELFAVNEAGIAWTVPLPGPGLGAPANLDGIVYAAFGARNGRPGGVAAFSSDTGTSKWTHDSEFEPGAPPAVGSLVLLPGKDSRVWALDPATGAVRWQFESFGEFTAIPSIAGRSAFAGSGDGRVHRLDLDDGGEAWVKELGGAVTGDPVIEGGVIVVGLANGRVVALREEDG